MTTKLTPKQRRILERLANGERLIQHWYTGKCKWKPTALQVNGESPIENKTIVDALHDRNLIISRPGFVYYSSGAYLDLEITEAGRLALTEGK